MISSSHSTRRTAERAKQNVRHRTVHRAAHENRKYETGEAVERAGDDQDVVRKHKAGGGGGETGVGV